MNSKNVSNELRENPSSFMESACEASHITDQNGNIIWANRKELDMLGYSPEEYIGRHISEFYPDRFKINDLLCKLIYNKEVENYPAELRCKDGRIINVLISTNICIEDGEFKQTRCFTRDISQMAELARKTENTHAKLLNQLLSTNTLIDNIASCSWKTGPWGEISKEQSDWTSYTGQSFEEQKHYGWVGAFHEGDQANIKESLKHFLKENKALKLFARVFSKKHNKYLYCAIFGIPYVSLNGKSHEWVYLLIDQTKSISRDVLDY